MMKLLQLSALGLVLGGAIGLIANQGNRLGLSHETGIILIQIAGALFAFAMGYLAGRSVK